jgi:cysteinyl-tRNA synthetase
MRLFNTLTRRVEEFQPISGNRVGMYTCGPTVYNHAHIGNFRTYMFEDLLRRQLKASGYEVRQVMNLTDVDDKTIRGANERCVSLAEYTAPYVEAFFADLKKLNIEPAEVYPAATAHVPEMIALIEKLIANGHAYRSEDGSVYFDVRSFPNYGRLAHLDFSGLKAGARVSQDEYEKEDLADFALWKAWDEKDGMVFWDSPWGRGRPGWHIECSAMSARYLGDTFDIHTGGVDNVFPHHENEIAQTEGATGKPFVKYWVHSEHLQVEGRKMAKSLGNFFTLDDILERGYTGREVRFVLISGHYRQKLNFTFAALDAARAALARVDECRGRLKEAAGTAGGDVPGWATEADAAFRAAMDDDLNVPEALAALFNLVHEVNRALDAGSLSGRAASGIDSIMSAWNGVLGVLDADSGSVSGEVTDLLAKRSAARTERRWADADAIRARIAELGWDVKDTPDGPRLKKL